MKSTWTILVPAAVLTAAVLASPLAGAADAKGPSCNDITYDAEFLAAYPRAAAACQEVVEANGKRAVRFSATVSRVKKDHIQLVFLNAMGKPIEPKQTLTLLPQSGQTLRVNGKDVAYDKLAKGDKVDFWIPEKTLGVISNPNATAVSTIVLP
ncbi:MAG: hypothetical protein U1F18_02605 [Steroidobacteraceae bacterium]|jgi:hypothetical protein